MKVQSYRDLEVWRKAMELVVLVYRQTAEFPKQEMYGLSSQLRRAAVSVPSNIAEGQGRRSTKEFLNHLSISRGSLMEVQTQVEIARQLGYCSSRQTQECEILTNSIARLLNALMNALERKLRM